MSYLSDSRAELVASAAQMAWQPWDVIRLLLKLRNWCIQCGFGANHQRTNLRMRNDEELFRRAANDSAPSSPTPLQLTLHAFIMREGYNADLHTAILSTCGSV